MSFGKPKASGNAKSASASDAKQKGSSGAAVGAMGGGLDLSVSGVGLSLSGTAIRPAKPPAPAPAPSGAASASSASSAASSVSASASGSGSKSTVSNGKFATMMDDGDDDEKMFGGVANSGNGGKDGDTDESAFSFDGPTGTADDKHFDIVVGALEDLIMDASFNAIQRAFLDEHCDEFDASSAENKLSYMRIFNEYVKTLESVIEQRLKTVVPGFDMSRFMTLLADRQNDICGDVMDLLSGIADFETFKDTILTHKAERDAARTQRATGFEGFLSVQPVKSPTKK